MSSRRKLLLGMALGALLLGGGIFGYVHAQTQVQQPNRLVCASARPGGPMREVGPAEAAERISDAFGVDKDEVQKAIEAKRDFRDIGRAAMLAKVICITGDISASSSGKSESSMSHVVPSHPISAALSASSKTAVNLAFFR